ncbi:hypothetical protein [Nocardia sputorum]|uniref:Uncharacterized protein n=1 Tax=Nocardia sputorum TaxID=2984338 RepID=A0ABM8CR59_9NOCA|nr:hypothetical protein [Nocardia sputorum]BDT97306.1 hypothetical protein IFM12276_03350 [Nocardia sputorum]
MSDTNTTPGHVTKAEITVARGYLRACVEYVSADPERSARIEALDSDAVYQRILRVWPEGWDHFREVFANDIADAEADERAAWFAEASQAARGHLFASRLPAAALRWGRCSLTATEAVTTLGADIAENRREAAEWHWIAEILGVPVPVAMAWAVEGRTRQLAAAIFRPFHTTEKEN